MSLIGRLSVSFCHRIPALSLGARILLWPNERLILRKASTGNDFLVLLGTRSTL